MGLRDHWLARYGFAVVAPVVALLFRIGVIRLAGGELPHFVTFYPVVMIAALFAGMGPGLATTATSAILAVFWILPAQGTPASHGIADIVGLGLFTGMGIFMSWVGGMFRRTSDYLKFEKKRFNDVLEMLPAYVILLTPDYRFFFANRFFRERFGDCEGKICYEYLFKRTEPCENCETYKPMETGTSHHWEWKGPDSRNYDIFDYPFKDADGSPLIMEMGIDITDRKRSEEELQEMLATLEARVEERTAELKRAKEEWERTFDSVPDLIAILDNNHRILRVNKSMADRMHCTPDNCIGQTCYKVVHGMESPPQFCPHLLTIADGKEHGVEIHEERLGGDFLVTTVALLDSEGKGIGSVHVAHDITERKKAENELRASREDLDRAQTVGGVGSWRLNIHKNELTWSDENHRIFGIPKGTPLAYETFLSTIHPDDREYVDKKWKAGLSGEPYDIEHRIVVADEIRWVREKAYLEFDENGQLMGGFGITHDITERKEAELELKKFYEELERRVKQRTDELMTVKRLSDIGTLASTVAHELRNPLGVIQLAVENMRRKKVSAELDKHFERIEKKVAESNLIINNLLFYSKIKKPNFEKTRIDKVLDESIGTSSAIFREKKAAVDKKYDILRSTVIEADQLQLREVFNNIIGNAFQALPNEGGTIEVTASRDSGGFVDIVIKDNGAGIRKEDIGRIFEPFYTTKSRGTGLGLTICSELVAMHGGRLEIDSEVGVGTIVRLSLPIERGAI